MKLNHAAISTWSARQRRAAAMIETAFMIVLLLILFFGMIDLGIAVLRRNMVAQVAREAARTASVHGEMASAYVAQWGPTTITVSGTWTGDVGVAIRPHLGALDPAETTLTLEWLDGDAQPESRIRAVVTSRHQPFMTSLFGAGAMTFSAVTTVQVNH